MSALAWAGSHGEVRNAVFLVRPILLSPPGLIIFVKKAGVKQSEILPRYKLSFEKQNCEAYLAESRLRWVERPLID